MRREVGCSNEMFVMNWVTYSRTRPVARHEWMTVRWAGARIEKLEFELCFNIDYCNYSTVQLYICELLCYVIICIDFEVLSHLRKSIHCID